MPSPAKMAVSSAFHHFGLAVILMIITENVQETMEDQMGQMRLERSSPRPPPRGKPSPPQARYRRESAARFRRFRRGAGKGQDIGRLVLAAKFGLSDFMWASSVKTMRSSGASASIRFGNRARRPSLAGDAFRAGPLAASRRPRPGYRGRSSVRIVWLASSSSAQRRRSRRSDAFAATRAAAASRS